MIDENLQDAIQLVNESDFAYCHYITPNDVGATGGHQSGFTFSKQCYRMFFDTPEIKGANKDCIVRIKWQKTIELDNRAIYYGQGTRNEYRITRFGRGFEFQRDEYIGSLQIMTKSDDGEINAYVLSDQNNIESFMATFNLNVAKGNQIIERNSVTSPDALIAEMFSQFVSEHDSFPDTVTMAAFARQCVCEANHLTAHQIVDHADSVILKWIDAEYQLFSALEERIYNPVYSHPFLNCQSLIDFSNTILNRRKSRAGKSLEHHLSDIFSAADLRFEEQAVTENNKKPDFLFPDAESYHNILFPADKLTMLGAKTTCKDRWRQVLNEANRIPDKHLFTLQRGVSRNQLQEMKDENLTLVIPKENIHLFLPEFRDNIMFLSDFIGMVKERQNA